MLTLMDAKLASAAWLAGDDFTIADIMVVFSLTTMRMFYALDIMHCLSILAYLESIVQREGYVKARATSDPRLGLMIDEQALRPFVQRLKVAGKT